MTAAYELLQRTDIKPVVYDVNDYVGGIAATAHYRGNRLDFGGHRFFSKSDRVMRWWQDILPLQGAPARDDLLLCRTLPLSQSPDAPDPEQNDAVMLIRQRLSRILFMGKFFDYPLSLNMGTIANLGPEQILRIGLSYLKTHLAPIAPEQNLEDFFINRFGEVLYALFFRDYTEKVWGISCDQIKPEWGKQRIKGLSVAEAVRNAVRRYFGSAASLDQKNVETSLIERFFYPKYGPGQLWEAVAERIREQGGTIELQQKVVGVRALPGRLTAVDIQDQRTGAIRTIPADYVLSTMPVKDLIAAFGRETPGQVCEVAQGLVYRDFITVGVLLKKLRIRNRTGLKTLNDMVSDNWIYIQETSVKLGRIQIFNNWSPYMVSDPDTVWLGCEYFCSEGDWLWNLPDHAMTAYAVDELARIHIIDKEDVLDSVAKHVLKAYPAYFGTYDQFSVIRDYTDQFTNLFLIGRNGMHRYNNMDHSMLTAMEAVEHIVSGRSDKAAIWMVNTEPDYHERR